MINHYFAGGNTACGFVGFYDNLLDRASANRFVTIKGGSGVGKSTVMKKVCAIFEDKFDVELFHCTGDEESLDGLCVPKLNLALVDGTSPHVTEPIFVGCGDENFDLSEFVKTEKISDKKDELKKLFAEKKYYYNLAYSYVKSAETLFENTVKLFMQTVNLQTYENLKKNVQDIARSIGSESTAQKQGFSRKLFDGAITASGEKYYKNVVDKPIVYLDGDKRLATQILTELYKIFSLQKIAVEPFFSPISCNYVYGINVFGTLITTNENISSTKTRVAVNLSDAIIVNQDRLADVKTQTLIYDELIENASKSLAKAKLCHEKVEKIYIPSVNFEGVNEKTKILLESLQKLI